MPKIEPFERHYQQYEDWFAENRYAYESELEAIRKFIPDNKQGIEIGIGSGLFAIPLGVSIGVEPSSAMRKLARNRGLTIYDGIAENLPLDNDSFDFALMVTTICFVDDVYKSFKEVYRVLKTNGSFIIGFVDAQSPLGQKYKESQHENVFYQIAEFYSCEKVLKILKKTKFEVIEIIQTIFGNLAKIKHIQNFKPGYGEGGFVVIHARKKILVMSEKGVNK